MPGDIFSAAGNDPLLSADVLTGATDPSLPDPLFMSTLDAGAADISSSGIGPTLTQLGADPNSPAIIGTASGFDPSAFNASPTTASAPGTSIFDSILKLGQIGVGIATAVTGQSGSINTPKVATKVGTAKSSTGISSLFGGSAGTSTGAVIFAVLAFVIVVFFLETKA